MKAQCPHCNQHYEIDDAYNGQIVECARCNREFVPEPLQNPQQLPKLKPLKPEPAENKQPAKTKTATTQPTAGAPIIVTHGVDQGALPTIIQVLALFILCLSAICFVGGFCHVESEKAIAFSQVAFNALSCSVFLFAAARVIQLLEKIEFNTRNRPGTKSNKPE